VPRGTDTPRESDSRAGGENDVKAASVKGSVVTSVVEDLAALHSAGRLAAERIEAALEADEIALLEEKIHSAGWYPMATYTRMLELLCSAESGSSPGWFTERGRRNARRLMDAGLYQQLAFIDRWVEDPEAVSVGHDVVLSFVRNAKLVATLAGSIYNVGRWTVIADPDCAKRCRIDVERAADYSEPMRFAAEGFLNECSRPREGDRPRPDLFRSERAARDLIRFHMTMDIEALRQS
jgi:hypothetical protein